MSFYVIHNICRDFANKNRCLERVKADKQSCRMVVLVTVIYQIIFATIKVITTHEIMLFNGKQTLVLLQLTVYAHE